MVNSIEVSSHATEVQGFVVGTRGERLAPAERTLKPAELIAFVYVSFLAAPLAAEFSE